MFDVHLCNRRKETAIELWSWKCGMILLPSTLNHLSGKMQRSVFPNLRPLVAIPLLDCIFLVDIFHSLSPHALLSAYYAKSFSCISDVTFLLVLYS